MERIEHVFRFYKVRTKEVGTIPFSQSLLSRCDSLYSAATGLRDRIRAA